MEAENTYGGGSLAFRGVLAILFGIAAVFWPQLTLTTLVYLFSTFILVSGLMGLVFGISNLMNEDHAVLTRVMNLVLGLVEIGVGVYLLRHPGVSFATLILLIGFALILRGVIEVVEGLFSEGPSFNRLLMVVIGLVTGLAGIVILFQPVSAGVAFVWILGLYALLTGPLLIALGMEANKAERALRR